MVLMDADAHSPELLAGMFDRAQGPCAVVEGVPEQPPAPSLWQRWLAPSKSIAPPPLLLLKRAALDALRAHGSDQQPLRNALRAANLPRAELNYVPQVRANSAPPTPWLGRVIADMHATWKRAPLALMTYFGAMVFVVGVFLAFWFSLQSVVAPNSVWFSWCYLIVLLHLLGGSILFSIGKLGALATRILEQVQERRTPVVPDAAPQSGISALLSPTQTRDAA